MKKSDRKGNSCHAPSTLRSKNLPAGLSKVPLRESARRYIRRRRSVSGMWRRRVRDEVLDMTISRVSRVPRVSVDRRGFHIFPRRVGPGTWYPYFEEIYCNISLCGPYVFYEKLKNVSCEYDRLNSWNSTLQAAWYIYVFYEKLKNVSCEYNRLNGWNSTLQAAWYIRCVRIIWFLWTKPTIWLLIPSFTKTTAVLLSCWASLQQ